MFLGGFLLTRSVISDKSSCAAPEATGTDLKGDGRYGGGILKGTRGVSFRPSYLRYWSTYTMDSATS